MNFSSLILLKVDYQKNKKDIRWSRKFSKNQTKKDREQTLKNQLLRGKDYHGKRFNAWINPESKGIETNLVKDTIDANAKDLH